MRILFAILFVMAIGPFAAAQGGNSRHVEPKTKDLPPAKSTVAVGLASSTTLVHSGDSAITALFDISEKLGVQTFFVVGGSDPTIYGIAASLKYLVHGTKDVGFHMGGGLGFGEFAKDQSFLSVGALAGFHFTIADRVLVHLDSGLTISKDEAPAGGSDSNQISIKGHSPLLGISMMYAF